jgi:hypothetical protein
MVHHRSRSGRLDGDAVPGGDGRERLESGHAAGASGSGVPPALPLARLEHGPEGHGDRINQPAGRRSVLPSGDRRSGGRARASSGLRRRAAIERSVGCSGRLPLVPRHRGNRPRWRVVATRCRSTRPCRALSVPWSVPGRGSARSPLSRRPAGRPPVATTDRRPDVAGGSSISARPTSGALLSAYRA